MLIEIGKPESQKEEEPPVQVVQAEVNVTTSEPPSTALWKPPENSLWERNRLYVGNVFLYWETLGHKQLALPASYIETDSLHPSPRGMWV